MLYLTPTLTPVLHASSVLDGYSYAPCPPAAWAPGWF